MAVPRRDRHGFPIMGPGIRKNPGIPTNLVKPTERPRSAPVPSVIVRVKGAAKPVGLVNIPDTVSGADLVIYMRKAYPDAAARTCDGGYVEFGRIDLIVHPSCDTAEMESAASVIATATEPNRWIPIQHASRLKPGDGGSVQFDPIRIPNIPDTKGGHELLAEIFRQYSERSVCEYTLYTSDDGDTPVHTLAAANPHLL